MKKTALFTLLPIAWVLALTACNTRKDYPEPNVGSHSPSYSSVFGRLQRIAGARPDLPPIWVLRFGNPQDAYQGELALTPPERMTGYSGGERVEVKGHVVEQGPTPSYNSRGYVVDSIQIWSSYR